MKKLINIISAFRYHLIALLWLMVVILMILGRKKPNDLNPTEYQSESGFNYMEDVEEFK